MTHTQRRMVGMVRAIKAGKWTNDPPTWAKHILTAMPDDDEPTYLDLVRAVQTAEAFIMLELTADSSFDVMSFVKACGF